VPACEVKDEMMALKTRKDELRARLARVNQPPPLLHPNMADIYRRKVTDLATALSDENSRAHAAEALRGLIECITLFADGESLRIELKGNLAAMLKAAEAPLTNGEDDDQLVQIMMVAGGGFEPPTFGL